MIEENARILENREIADSIFQMVLQTAIGKTAQPGQFIELAIPGFFLRRPISIASIASDQLAIIYKTVGKGTCRMAEMKKNEIISILGPLGNGFPIEKRDVLLIGGGAGLPPLYETAARYRKNHQKVTVAAGFASKKDVFYQDEFEKLGCEMHIATMDGSEGTQGTALDALRANHIKTDFVLACGPVSMLKAVSDTYHNGYISLESRMGCGLGVCNGCVVKDTEGNSLRVCHEGPVFPIGKVVL